MRHTQKGVAGIVSKLFLRAAMPFDECKKGRFDFFLGKLSPKRLP